MQTPTIYLVSSRLTAEQADLIAQAFRITPLSAVIISDPRHAELAKLFSETVSTLKQPIALVADFETPLTAIDENGSLCPLL